jgi:hypothetical protein
VVLERIERGRHARQHLDPRVTLAIYALVKSEELPQPSTLDAGVV